MSSKRYDVVVVGGGIVGLATARALLLRRPLSLLLLEAESRVATHQTGHNSGVIHSGLYYRPGSLKARNCTAGREELYRFCAEQEIPHERCGKLVLATTEEEVERLRDLERRGRSNGLDGLARVPREGLRDYEPHVRGVEGLWVPQTGIVDFRAVAQAMARQIEERGGRILTSRRVASVQARPDGFTLNTPEEEVWALHLINCAGLQSDRLARACGCEPGLRIVPFRGEYYRLVPDRQSLVKNLIYPVPDPRFPFLGVHFTRMIGGGVEAGPNAVLALRREGYSRWSFSWRDTLETLGYGGFWRLAARYWSTGIGEVARSYSKRAFVSALQRLVPEIEPRDLRRHGAGVRAQAVTPEGDLADDFRIVEGEKMMHVLNAPSPAATASLSIGRALAERFEGSRS